MKNKGDIISGLITLFVVAPIWYYLFYKILEYCHATELMWFLYWIYVPVAIFASIIEKIWGSKE
jgi:hypothetical protein